MFKSNGIRVPMGKIKKLFSIVDLDNSGDLTIEEFKLFMKSKDANDCKQL